MTLTTDGGLAVLSGMRMIPPQKEPNPRAGKGKRKSFRISKVTDINK